MLSPGSSWSAAEIEQFCWDAGVLTLVSTLGFRKAATDEFRKNGFRLATISQDIEPFDYIHKLSLYSLTDQPRLSQRKAKQLAQDVMKKIGLHLKPGECDAEVSGRRLVVSVALPHWVWPRVYADKTLQSDIN